MLQGAWQPELTHAEPMEGPPSRPRPVAAPALFLLFTVSLRPNHWYLWSSNNCYVVVLQEQSLFSPGGTNCSCWGMREEGWNASPALPVSLQTNDTDPDQWETTAAQQTRTTEMEKEHKGAFLWLPRVNLIVTKHAPELIWVNNLSQHTAGISIRYFPSASLTHLLPWTSRKPAWHLKPHLCHLHSQERIFILC